MFGYLQIINKQEITFNQQTLISKKTNFTDNKRDNSEKHLKTDGNFYTSNSDNYRQN